MTQLSIYEFLTMSKDDQIKVCRHWRFRSDNRTVPSSVISKGLYLILANSGLMPESHIVFSQGEAIHFFTSFECNGQTYYVDEVGIYADLKDVLADFRDYHDVEHMSFDQYDYRCGANQTFRLDLREHSDINANVKDVFEKFAAKASFSFEDIFNPFRRDAA